MLFIYITESKLVKGCAFLKTYRKTATILAEQYQPGMEDVKIDGKPYLKTLEGLMCIPENGWIATGAKGERWASEKADIAPKIGPKTPRKTIESWMLKCGIPEIEIYGRAGHDPVTSLKHYQSLSFNDYEMRDIEKIEYGI